MDRDHVGCRDPLDPLLAALYLLRQVPEVKVDKHTANDTHARGVARARAALLVLDEAQDFVPHALDGDDARRAQAELLA